MAAAARTSFTDRMIRAARLDAAVYEEVESDRTATTEAAMVVVLGAIAAGIGSNIRLGLVALRAALDCGTARAIVVAVIASISQYLLTAVLLYLQTSA